MTPTWKSRASAWLEDFPPLHRWNILSDACLVRDEPKAQLIADYIDPKTLTRAKWIELFETPIVGASCTDTDLRETTRILLKVMPPPTPEVARILMETIYLACAEGGHPRPGREDVRCSFKLMIDFVLDDARLRGVFWDQPRKRLDLYRERVFTEDEWMLRDRWKRRRLWVMWRKATRVARSDSGRQ